MWLTGNGEAIPVRAWPDCGLGLAAGHELAQTSSDLFPVPFAIPLAAGWLSECCGLPSCCPEMVCMPEYSVSSIIVSI